jgi:hypothetical protein
MSVSVQISAISIVLDPLAQSDADRDNEDIITETSMFTKARPGPAGAINGRFRGSRNVTSVNRTDVAHSQVEPRFYCFGRLGKGMLSVRFTYRDKVIRIIGAGNWRKGKKVYET